MGEAADQPGNDVVRREIQASLAEVDAELAGLVRGVSDFEERAERIKRRLTAPEFLSGAEPPRSTGPNCQRRASDARSRRLHRRCH
jgi:hypothetical protein